MVDRRPKGKHRGQRGSAAPLQREMGGGVRIVQSVGSNQTLFRRKLITGQPLAFKSDAAGTVSATSTPVNGVTTLALSLFTMASTIANNADQLVIHEWLFEIRPVSNNSGSSYFWVDFDDTNAASAVAAAAKNAVTLTNSNTSANAGVVVLRGTPPKAPPYTTAFSPGGSLPYATASLKWYTDGTLMGTGNSAFLYTITPRILADGIGLEV